MKLRSNRDVTFKEIPSRKVNRRQTLKTRVKLVKRMTNPVTIGPQNNPEKLDDDLIIENTRRRKNE